MQHYHKKSGIDSFKTRRYSSPLYFTLSRFYQTNVFEHASEHQRNKTSQFCKHTASTQLRTLYKNWKPNRLVKKNSMRKKLSKNTSDRCCRTNKAGIQNKLFAEEEFWPQNYNFSSKKSFLHQDKIVSRKRQGQADWEQNKLKRYTGEYLPI